MRNFTEILNAANIPWKVGYAADLKTTCVWVRGVTLGEFLEKVISEVGEGDDPFADAQNLGQWCRGIVIEGGSGAIRFPTQESWLPIKHRT